MIRFKPPVLQFNGHLQTIVAARLAIAPYPQWQRECFELYTAEGNDVCEADWLHPFNHNHTDNILVLFHGLEGNSHSHYARSIGAYFQAHGWRVVVPHFRGCGGTQNRLLRAYHSGDALEIARLLYQVQARYPKANLYAMGVSLGANALLCYASQRINIHKQLAQELTQKLNKNTNNHNDINLNINITIHLKKIISVCPPLNLHLCESALNQGFSTIYRRSFMKTLRLKSLEKSQLFPNTTVCDWKPILKAKTIREFDDAYTAPVHGFKDVNDYYDQASSIYQLSDIQIPTVILNSHNDPFVPSQILKQLHDVKVSPSVLIETVCMGGHVGFAQQTSPLDMIKGNLNWLPQWLYQMLMN